MVLYCHDYYQKYCQADTAESEQYPFLRFMQSLQPLFWTPPVKLAAATEFIKRPGAVTRVLIFKIQKERPNHIS